VTLTIIEMLRVNAQIHEMSYYEVPLKILRDGKIVEVSSLHIVPGDIVFFNKTIRLPFEGVLLEGEMLINECVLTGESVPVVKKAEQY
jgi:cation-transporting ATPase 13A2